MYVRIQQKILLLLSKQKKIHNKKKRSYNLLQRIRLIRLRK